jgi:hypothetical protein
MESGKFANSKNRMIRMSDKGVPYVMTKEGKRSYKPKAAFKKNSTGTLIRLKPTNAVPKMIAPARIPAPSKAKGGPRKMRKNVGVKRGPREATLYRMVFGSAKMPGAARKMRSNKGMKRKLISSPSGTYKGRAAATRRKTTQVSRKLVAQNPYASLLMRS